MRKIREPTKLKCLLDIEDTAGWTGAYAAMNGVRSRSTTRTVSKKFAGEPGKAGAGQVGKGDVDMGEGKQIDESGDKGAEKGVVKKTIGEDKGEDKSEDVDGRAGSGGEKLVAKDKGKTTTRSVDKGLKSGGEEPGKQRSVDEIEMVEEEKEEEKKSEKAPRNRDKSQLKKPVAGEYRIRRILAERLFESRGKNERFFLVDWFSSCVKHTKNGSSVKAEKVADWDEHWDNNHTTPWSHDTVLRVENPTSDDSGPIFRQMIDIILQQYEAYMSGDLYTNSSLEAHVAEVFSQDEWDFLDPTEEQKAMQASDAANELPQKLLLRHLLERTKPGLPASRAEADSGAETGTEQDNGEGPDAARSTGGREELRAYFDGIRKVKDSKRRRK
ncbi:hypothetical protein SLS59_002944 [Nothophoma quercina]|uniref:Uncharacterized protein n=1 Tax=Nothophoma quercina TaxID=749835 RepID=A0ABR3RN20_9PLEO